VATIGLFLYAVFAPHSIAGAEIAVVIVATGWIIRTIATRKTGFRHTSLDLPICLFAAWTLTSAVLSEEPRISIAKLQSLCLLFLFYLSQATVIRRTAILIVILMIASGAAGILWSIYDLTRGRGVIVESISSDSPFREAGVEKGDAIWRIGGQRVYSKAEIDELIRRVNVGARVTISVITHGEHAERPGFAVTSEMKSASSPSGLTGSERAHRFRASGWTRHYETFAEIIQILAQLSLGLGLANLSKHGPNRRFKLAAAATSLLALGIALTAMRTALVAFAFGACLVAWRAGRGKSRSIIPLSIAIVLAMGTFMVWNTRATNAIWLQDASSMLRARVARVGLSRIMLHPVFGHGMDAVKQHWTEWGFPGSEMIHLHSTLLQIAFDRGIPAVIFWLWIVGAFWLLTTRAEKSARDSRDTNSHGILLGATGALAGFFASSLVNYNFGDAEVALVFWWLMGSVVVLSRPDKR
jgi:O-antigen ligase/polysaccharide polymerase Wzy-like membrane protein/PDZ domain-containing protein